MATNYMQDGEVLTLEIADIASGDPILYGAITGVAITDTNSAGEVEVKRHGVFYLSVKGTDSAGNKSVAKGDKLYFDGTTINKNDTKTYFGVSLGTVSAGSTSIIPVLLA